MRFLVLFFFSILMFSCYEDSEFFIPHDEEGPLESLKSLIPSTSDILQIDNGEDHVIVTDYNVQLLVESGTFLSKAEASDISYQLHLIEMKNYADFMLHNNDHYTGDKIYSPFYSIYVDASLNSNSLDLQTGEKLVVRVPSQEPVEELVLGRGMVNQNKLVFDYNIDGLVDAFTYTGWTITSPDGKETIEYGYEFELGKPGWYSLASPVNNTRGDFEFCISVPDQFDKSNTLVYLLSSDFNFITRMNSDDYNPSFCSSELMLHEGGGVKLITISKIEDQYYFSENQVIITDNGLDISINPSLIKESELKQRILSL
ncbi:MAG: hypothetical protein HKN67_04025 [Saprospiraceae bacterium]|nr:hypothetical protein [Saprospiraceae bacterium]